MFSNAKVGDKVFSKTYGFGEVQRNEQVYAKPIEVIFERHGNIVKYTNEGKFDKFAISVDLFNGEKEIENV